MTRYEQQHRDEQPGSALLDYLLAIAIGGGLALALVSWWSS